MIRSIYLTSLLIFCASCSENGGVISPITYGDMTDVIFFSSFESGREPSTSGWQPQSAYSSGFVSFSDDVPHGGGYWSLYLRRSLGPDSIGEIVYSTSLSMTDTIENYIVTFWAKGKGDVSLTVEDFSDGWYNGSAVDVSTWTFFADTLNRYEARYNTLELRFAPQWNDSLSSIHVDNVKLIKRKPKSPVLANQSLKLTEVAVDDFAARQYAENNMINKYVRAMNYMEMAVRRRSLAPVR